MDELSEATILRDFNETQSIHTWSPFVSDGPSHMPTFSVYLYINNNRYKGCGSSKKRAKINAIKMFKSSNSNIENPQVVNGVLLKNKRKCTEISPENPSVKRFSIDTNLVVSQTSAVSILHEIFTGQNLVYEHEQSHGLLETISVTVSGTKYLGYGKNKKEAKEIACRNALKALYKVNTMDNKFKDQIEMLRTDYEDSKIIDYFAYITDIVYQQLEFDSIKNKLYSVIASIIKVN